MEAEYANSCSMVIFKMMEVVVVLMMIMIMVMMMVSMNILQACPRRLPCKHTNTILTHLQ